MSIRILVDIKVFPNPLQRLHEYKVCFVSLDQFTPLTVVSSISAKL